MPQKMFDNLVLFLLWAGLISAQPLFKEEMFRANASGTQVVETVVDALSGTCLLDNPIFLRRMAQVETRDGTEPQTYASGNSGGIWNIDHQMFLETKNNTQLLHAYDVIKRRFGIDWSDVTWDELRQPIKSGIASMLLILAKHILVVPEIREIQGVLWSTLNPTRNQPFDFINKLYKSDVDCIGDKNLDLVIVLDFQQLSPYNLRDVHAFIEALLGNFQLDLTATRVGIVSKRLLHPVATWYLNSQQGQMTAINTLRALTYEAGGPTTTADALFFTHHDMFTATHGARNFSRKVALIVTDGITDPSNTKKQAKEMEEEGIHVMVAKVTLQHHNPDEEKLVTSPKCANVKTASSFSNLTNIIERLTSEICKASPLLSVGSHTFPCNKNIAAKLSNSDKGLSVRVTPSNGVVTFFGAQYYRVPDDSSHDVSLVSRASNGSVLYVRGTNPMYVAVKGQGPSCTGTYTVEIREATSFMGTEGACIVAGTVRRCNDLDMDLTTHDVVLVRDMAAPNLCNPDDPKLEMYPHPTDTHRYYMCDRDDHTYIGLCPLGGVGGTATCKPFSTGCKYTNPCTIEAALQRQAYFIDPCGTVDHFVTCTGLGVAEVSRCPPSRVWNEDTNHCVFQYVHDPITNQFDKSIDNPCIHAHGEHEYYPYPKAQNKYIFCDHFGNAVASTCRSGVWNEQMKSCTTAASNLIG